MQDERRDDGSITVASRLREAEAHDFPDGFLSVDLLPILGESAWVVSEDDNIGLECAIDRLARLIDPTTRQAADGTCEMCGAGPEALRDQYCAHCGRRIVRDAKGDAAGDAAGDATEAIEAINKAQYALYAAIAKLSGDTLRKCVRMGLTIKLNMAVAALLDIEDIVRRESKEGAE